MDEPPVEPELGPEDRADPRSLCRAGVRGPHAPPPRVSRRGRPVAHRLRRLHAPLGDEGLPHRACHCRDAGRQASVLVFWPFDEKVRVATIQDMLQTAREKGYRHVILVHSGVITPFAANHLVLEKDHEVPVRVETFPIECFQYDLMAHRLVPDAVVLGPEEEKAFLREKRVAKKELSKILTVEPVAKYLGMRPGQQILRTRRPTAGGLLLLPLAGLRQGP